MKQKNIFLILFIIAALVDLFNLAGDFMPRLLSKGIIIPLLICYYLSHKKALNLWILVALIFSFFGDVFLIGDDLPFFLIGLACFLIAQLNFAKSFYEQTSLWLPRQTIITVAIVGYLIVLLTLLMGKQDDTILKFSIIAYGISIALMAIMAFWRHPRFKGYSTLIAGVLLFMLSDSILGIDKFYQPIPYSSYFIMISYLAAQFLIVRGYVLSKEV